MLMIRAYDETYLADAMSNLGEAFDYAVCGCNMAMDTFFELFISSGIAQYFEKGVPKYVAGMSGTELVFNVLYEIGIEMELPKELISYDYSSYYWCGWILAYYQWYTGRSFKNISTHITMQEIERLYPTLHEASEQKFVDVLNYKIQNKKNSTRLQIQRKLSGYSQRELAQKSGISLRTLQQYEIRAKDINKAASISVYTLANVLGCRVEDLLEYE